MVIFIVVINTLVSLILFYVAWRVWQLKQKMANIANILSVAERRTHAALQVAPPAMSVGQRNIYNLRYGNQPLQIQIQQIQQIFSLLAFGQRVWRRYFFSLRSKSLKKRK